ncbi:MAG: KdsC family phosphatase [Acidobacteriota bacterium]
MPLSTTARERARRVRFLLLDVDGVLTDGRIWYLPEHETDEAKAFDSKDGVGIRLAQEAGLGVGLLTGRSSSPVARRAGEMGIAEVIQGAWPKLPAYLRWQQGKGISDDEICYVGDDIADVPILRRVVFPATVSDAHPEALRSALVVSTRAGGRGAVREIIDMLLVAQEKWNAVVGPLLGE